MCSLQIHVEGDVLTGVCLSGLQIGHRHSLDPGSGPTKYGQLWCQDRRGGSPSLKAQQYECHGQGENGAEVCVPRFLMKK